jgi:ectoine utilization protein EutC
MPILVLTEQEIRQTVTMPEAMEAIEEAFAALARGEARLPDVIGLEVPEVNGEIHVKGAHLQGAPYAVFKVATGFWENPAQGLPVGSGLMMAFDATTGFPAALLLDNGYLTDLRTGAAGGVAANYLANPVLNKVTVIGSGIQARFQLRALAVVRQLTGRVAVWSRNRQHTDAYAKEMVTELEVDVTVAPNIEAALRNTDLVITTTPSRKPLVRAEWLRHGVHINAVGSDAPDKQELDVNVLSRADIIIADRLSQCLRLGEIHHAVEAGVIGADDVAGELGDLIIGTVPGRTDERQITVCDLTGVGVQDAAIASLVLEKARVMGLGSPLEPQ